MVVLGLVLHLVVHIVLGLVLDAAISPLSVPLESGSGFRMKLQLFGLVMGSKLGLWVGLLRPRLRLGSELGLREFVRLQPRPTMGLGQQQHLPCRATRVQSVGLAFQCARRSAHAASRGM